MGLVVKRFTATWCGPCKTLAPIMMTVQIKNPTVQFQTIDIEDSPQIAKDYGIRSVPTVILEKDGKIVDTIMGAMPESAYISAISNWK
jgi:thioredoxin 1